MAPQVRLERCGPFASHLVDSIWDHPPRRLSVAGDGVSVGRRRGTR